MINVDGRRALLLVNPFSRRGADEGSLARELLLAARFRLVEADVGKHQTLSDVIRERRDEADLVVVGGGDGSLNAAAAGLLETGLPLGVLPLGTANDFARTMKIPTDLTGALAVIIRGRIAEVDLGMANDHPFLNVASIGFSAELAASLTATAKKRWGKLGYAIVAGRLLASSRLFTAFLEHDGTTEEFRTFQVSIGNGRFYGGGMTVQENASAMDGLLDFYSLEVDHWWRLLRLLPSLRKGTQSAWDEVRAFSTTSLAIRTSRPRAVNLDGELKTYTPTSFRVLEKAIKVYAPGV